MQTVCQTNPFQTYYGDSARVVKARDGSFRTVGCGFAGRVRYRTVERAKASVETHAQFTGWAA